MYLKSLAYSPLNSAKLSCSSEVTLLQHDLIPFFIYEPKSSLSMPHTAVALSKQAEGNSPGCWWAGLSSRCRFQAELCMQQQGIAKALESAGVAPLCRRYAAHHAVMPPKPSFSGCCQLSTRLSQWSFFVD